MWIASQVFASFALASIVCAMLFSKTRKQILIFVILFNASMAVSSALVENWLLVGIAAVAVARDIVFLWREKYYPNNRRLEIGTLILFLAISTLVAGFTINWVPYNPWHHVLAIFTQVAALFLIYGAWSKGVHLIRLSRIGLCIVFIINHILFQNYVSIITEVFALGAICAFYGRYFYRKRHVENCEEDLDVCVGPHCAPLHEPLDSTPDFGV